MKEFILKPLPYAFGSLEPYIEALIMELHHDRHQKAYVDNLNAALKDYPEWQDKSLRGILKSLDEVPEVVRTAVRNNAGGVYNHQKFWTYMSPNGGGIPNGKLAEQINKQFGSFDAFKDKFNAVAKSVFGSGWAWLSLDKSGDLVISSTPNQDNPISEGKEPLMGLDVWEHAYYLQYYNKRPDYISAWWNVVNWHRVEENYRKF